jgi:hypothetical protein
MHPVGFEPTIAASERPQTQASDCAATRITFLIYLPLLIIIKIKIKFTLAEDTKAQMEVAG